MVKIEVTVSINDGPNEERVIEVSLTEDQLKAIQAGEDTLTLKYLAADILMDEGQVMISSAHILGQQDKAA